MNLTTQILFEICPAASPYIIQGIVPAINLYFPLYGIDATQTRVAFFLGQAAEETAGFRTLTEYASGAEYEGRHDLGNTIPGDGVRYKGRGIFQITGRGNYSRLGAALNIDLVNNPLEAADPVVAVRTACEYWKSHKLQTHPDTNDIEAMTRAINGGLNGLADRIMYTHKAMSLLGPAFVTVASPINSVVTQVLPPVETSVPPAPITQTAQSSFWSWL